MLNYCTEVFWLLLMYVWRSLRTWDSAMGGNSGCGGKLGVREEFFAFEEGFGLLP